MITDTEVTLPTTEEGEVLIEVPEEMLIEFIPDEPRPPPWIPPNELVIEWPDL